MAVLSATLRVKKSGGTTNTDPNASLGGHSSTETDRFFVSNFLHNMFDETNITEASTGDTEYRHFYFTNTNSFALNECKLQILSNTQEKWSKVAFAKGTAQNGFVEQAVPDENTAPSGISEDAWIVSGELSLGTILAGELASIWTRRTVLPGALISDLQKVSFRIMGTPPPGSGTPVCPTGQHWDTTTLTCVNDSIVTCPEGQVLQNGVCVPVSCPTGYHLEGTACVPDDGTGGGGGGSGPLPERVILATVGDIGCDTQGEDTIAFINLLTTLSHPVDLFIANGDLTYTSSPDCLVDNLNTAPQFADSLWAKTKISIGNHDDTEDGNSSYRAAALTAFGVPSGGYYSFQIQNIFCIVMDTQRDYSTNSTQYTFVNAALQSAFNSGTVDWIIVFYHKPSMTAPSNHSALTDFRTIYHPLFDTYRVDLIINGHNHNMQRTYPITYNAASPSTPTIMSTSPDNIYNNVNGRIFVVSGAGGDSHYSIGSQPAWYAFTEDNTFGVFTVETQNSTTERVMWGTFFSAESGSAIEELHTFRINKTV